MSALRRRRLVLSGGGGNVPAWLPAGAVAFADFRLGHYYAGGAETTAGVMFTANEADYGPFDSASIIGGTGLVGGTGEYPTLTHSFLGTLLTAGGTYVLYADLASAGLFGFDVVDFPDYNTQTGMKVSESDVGQAYVPSGSPTLPAQVSAGLNKFAATVSADGSLSYSVNGEVVDATANGNGWAPTDIGIAIQHGTLLSVTIYPPKPDADLPALSTV